jgi:diaminopimelate decarboxylase
MKKKNLLSDVVDKIMAKQRKILAFTKKYPTPFYLFDEEELNKSIKSFKTAFNKHIPGCHIFYAMKSNDNEYILKAVVKSGFGIDVSSGRELLLALKHDPANIIFSGPGKTINELRLAFKYRDKVIINVDSFSELRKIKELSEKLGQEVNIGVRILTKFQKPWTKFGIPLDQLRKFYLEVQKYEKINFKGIQFHVSWNRDTERYEETIAELGKYLKTNFSKEERLDIKFIDLGGGFYPNLTEGYYPWMYKHGIIWGSANHVHFPGKYSLTKSLPIEVFAEKISKAISKHFSNLLTCEYYFEPGRIISTKAMHVVLKVVDIKDENMAIVDGGINALGWEYGEQYYYPIVNLTHFAKKEITRSLFGPPCTPRDI